MTSREHPTATITTPNSTPGQSGRFGSESVAAFVGMRTLIKSARFDRAWKAIIGATDTPANDNINPCAVIAIAA